MHLGIADAGVAESVKDSKTKRSADQQHDVEDRGRKTLPRPAMGWERRRWTLFCWLAPRRGPRLDSLFGSAIEKLQLAMRHDKIIDIVYAQILSRGEPREDFLAFELSARQRAGDDPFRTQVFPVLHFEAERDSVCCARGARPKMLWTEADNYVAEFDKVHRRRAQEGGNEGIGRIVIDVSGCADLVHDTFIQNHDAVAHGHGFHLIVRDVDGGRTYAAVELLELLASRGSELGVEVGERFIEKKDGRFTHNGARQCDPLTLASREFARLAFEERANAKKRCRPFYFSVMQIFFFTFWARSGKAMFW